MSIRKALAWSYASQAFVFLVTFGSSVVVARILGPYEMGVFAIAMATAGLLSILSSFGVGTYLVQHETVGVETRKTVFTVNALINVVIASAMLVTAYFGAVFGLNDSVGRVLTLIAISPLVGIFEFLPSSLMQRDMQFRTLALLSMGRVVVTSATVVAFASTGFGSVSPAFAIVAASVYGAVAANIVGRRYASVGLSLKGWRDVMRFGAHMMTIGGVGAVANRICEIALGRILGLAALGTYVRASSLADQIWSNVYGQAARVIFTKMAVEKRETGTLSRTFLGGIAIITAVMWPFVIGVAVLAGPIVQLLYGDRWLAAALPLSLLMLSHFVGLGIGLNWELCVLNKQTGWQARMETVRAVVGTIAFAIGSFFGLAGAAGGRVFESLTGFAMYAPKMREMGGAGDGQLSKIFGESAALTVAAAGPVAIVMVVEGWSPATSWWYLTPAIVLGIVAWLITLRVLRHTVLDELTRLLAALRPLRVRLGL